MYIFEEPITPMAEFLNPSATQDQQTNISFVFNRVPQQTFDVLIYSFNAQWKLSRNSEPIFFGINKNEYFL